MLSQYFATVLLLSVNYVQAFRAWIPQCSSPPDGITWVSSTQVRGTMDIIWSCLSVLLLCTWTIQHLAVPKHIEPREHSWNRKFVKNAHYSAFLDDLRFNVTKTKWMAVSFIAPEYILAKALMEYLAARNSRRDFRAIGVKEWTSTHAYFANMRGFILRFKVAAVPTSLEPTKPAKSDDFGRSLQMPTPHGDPPYFEQDAERAEAIELMHCNEICKIPCRNRPDGAVRDRHELASKSQAQFSLQSGDLELDDLEALPRRAATAPITQVPMAPNDSLSRPSEDSMALSFEDPASGSAIPRHGYPKKAATTIDVHSSKSPLLMDSSAVISDPSLRRSKVAKASIAASSKFHNKPTASKETLGPHKPWQAQWALSSLQMYYAYCEGIISLPPVTAEDLNDRSKGDALVKLAAIVQITWLVIQIIARAFQSLAITQLEITVLAFAACSIITYSLLLQKPQDVKVPTYIDAKPEVLTRKMIIGLAARSPVSTMMVHQFWLHGVVIRAMADNVFPWSPGIKPFVPKLMKEPVLLNPVLLGIGFGGVVFGGVHFTAWDFHFPSSVERLLWQISCTYLVAAPLIGTWFYCILQHFERTMGIKDNQINAILKPLGRIFVPLYLLARLYLLVEVFRCLAFPPPSAFRQVNWPSFIPHIN